MGQKDRSILGFGAMIRYTLRSQKIYAQGDFQICYPKKKESLKVKYLAEEESTSALQQLGEWGQVYSAEGGCLALRMRAHRLNSSYQREPYPIIPINIKINFIKIFAIISRLIQHLF